MTQLSMFEPLAPGVPMRPSEPIIRQALIEGKYRRWLRRGWGSGQSVAWCGLNPSDADGEKDDPTMREEIGFSYRWGFGSLIKVNVFPFISSKPREMEKWLAGIRPDTDSLKAYSRNTHDVVAALSETDVHVAAWGNDAPDAWLKSFLRVVDNAFGMPVDWKCLRHTSTGAPIHTLARGVHRLPRDAKLMPWVRP